MSKQYDVCSDQVKPGPEVQLDPRVVRSRGLARRVIRVGASFYDVRTRLRVGEFHIRLTDFVCEVATEVVSCTCSTRRTGCQLICAITMSSTRKEDAYRSDGGQKWRGGVWRRAGRGVLFQSIQQKVSVEGTRRRVERATRGGVHCLKPDHSGFVKCERVACRSAER